MKKEEYEDWLYRLRSELVLWSPADWKIKFQEAIDDAIKARKSLDKLKYSTGQLLLEDSGMVNEILEARREVNRLRDELKKFEKENKELKEQLAKGFLTDTALVAHMEETGNEYKSCLDELKWEVHKVQKENDQLKVLLENISTDIINDSRIGRKSCEAFMDILKKHLGD